MLELIRFLGCLAADVTYNCGVEISDGFGQVTCLSAGACGLGLLLEQRKTGILVWRVSCALRIFKEYLLMAIAFKCLGCGQVYSVPEQSAGKKARCKACGNTVVIPAAASTVSKQPVKGGAASAPSPKPAQKPIAGPSGGGKGKEQVPDERSAREKTFDQVAAVASGGAEGPAGPQGPSRSGAGPRPHGGAAAAPGGAALHAMKCASCGGRVEFKSGQGIFQCKFCGSQYNATTNEAGKAVVQTVMLRELKQSVDRVDGELRAERLQKKAANVQDQLDHKYVEFFHSLPRKAGSAAFVLWIIGAVAVVAGLDSDIKIAAVGAVLIAAGVGAFMWFKQADKAYQKEAAELQ
jgi:DNA-directed RNA polymerase subunit RPC12/RpoP